MSKPFSHLQTRFLCKFAEALFHGFKDLAIPIDQIVKNFETQFDLIGDQAKDEMRDILGLRWFWLDPFFTEMDVAQRRHVIDCKLRYTNDDDRQDLARLRSIVYGAYYGHWLAADEEDNKDNPVHAQIGFTLPKFRKRAGTADDRTIERVEGREIDRSHVLEPYEIADDYEIIVVGSGSGGGVAAYNLAVEHGYKKVLIIEAGPFMPSKAITHEERRMGAHLYKDGTLQSTKDKDIILFQGRCVGGSPTVNNGICLRIWNDPLGNPQSPNPFDDWKNRLGLDLEAPFMTAYDQVADYLGIDEVEHPSGKGNGAHLKAGWEKWARTRTEPWAVQAKAGWFRKSFGPPNTDKACVSCGYCNTGCPYARKANPAQTHLPDACRAGARILPNATVQEITWAARDHRGDDRRATGVIVRLAGEDEPRQISATVGVVVAAGTIASSILLDESGIANTGEDISLIVASPVVALMLDETSTAAERNAFTPSWDEDQMTTAVECGDFLLESHFQPPQSMAMLMPGWFGDMDKRMRAYGQIRSAGILIPIDSFGKLKNNKLKAQFSEREMERLRLALATLTKVHFAAGAKQVWPGLRTGHGLCGNPTEAEIDRFFADEVRQKDDVTLSSAHIHGGNTMSIDPDDGVVDPRCKVHGTTNVFVTDASVFPGNIRVNAHFSTMALAQYATYPHDPFKPRPVSQPIAIVA